MRCATSLRLLAGIALLGFDGASGAPPTSIIPNGLGTTVAPLSPQPRGTYYNISGGTTEGGNLFHSFSTFNLGTGDTADFNVSNNISNILARVTGGPSTIDGTITSTNTQTSQLSSANLFLINPAGVMFTASAQVNLGGSFVVTTASYIKFSDGSYFYGDVSHPIQDAGLSSAPVSAFGFLSSSPPPISFAGSQITMQPGTGLHVIGGDITIDQGSPGGNTEQGTNLDAPSGNLTLFSAASAGEVPFSLASPGSGYATAPFSAFGNISVQNQSGLAIDGSEGGGSVVIRGGKLAIDGSSVTSFNSGATQGGGISIEAESLSMTNGAVVSTDTYGSGAAGSVAVEVAGDASISGTNSFGVGSEISANTETAANGGTISFRAGGQLTLENDGVISTNSDGTGNAGAITVEASSADLGSGTSISAYDGRVEVDVNGPLHMTNDSSIAADTQADAGGDVIVNALQLDMSGTSQITADATYFSGAGGQVYVNAGSISIEGIGHLVSSFNGLIGETGITADSLYEGNAGSVHVTTGQLSLDGGAVISAECFAAGNGGSVTVNCTQAQLTNQSEISTTSMNDAGSVTIQASSLSLSGGSLINTSAGDNGGNISLHVGQLLYLDSSEILAFAGEVSFPGQAAGGKGGNILIDPQFVVLGDSLISANDLASIGSNGNIINTADFFFSSDSTLHATGTIDTTAVDLNLARSLVVLPDNLVHAQNQLRERCASAMNHEFSSLIVVGRGGSETAPEELQSDFGVGNGN